MPAKHKVKEPILQQSLSAGLLYQQTGNKDGIKTSIKDTTPFPSHIRKWLIVDIRFRQLEGSFRKNANKKNIQENCLHKNQLYLYIYMLHAIIYYSRLPTQVGQFFTSKKRKKGTLEKTCPTSCHSFPSCDFVTLCRIEIPYNLAHPCRWISGYPSGKQTLLKM